MNTTAIDAPKNPLPPPPSGKPAGAEANAAKYLAGESVPPLVAVEVGVVDKDSLAKDSADKDKQPKQ